MRRVWGEGEEWERRGVGEVRDVKEKEGKGWEEGREGNG
jgi:hypothetical protein